tara:strand:+ start:1250 stop:1789 length:540 start_codon:yes stop_codon:yes gene_type:complete
MNNCNNLSNLPNAGFNNNAMMGESLTIHSLIEMHGNNKFNAIPRIACMLRNINDRDPETPIELALNLKKYNLVKYLRNHNAKINFNFNTNNFNHLKQVVEAGIKPTNKDLKMIIKKLVSTGRNKELLTFFVTEYHKRKKQNKTMKQVSQLLVRKRARTLLADKNFRGLPEDIRLKILLT